MVVLIQGWSESGAWKNSLLKKVLESIPGVVVVVPDYLDGTGLFAKFKSHLTVEQYSITAKYAIWGAKSNYPDAAIMVVGHSLGGVIARYLCAQGLFPAKNMILAGTPNWGINFGWFVNGIMKVLARIFKVPVVNQLLEGSSFIEDLNKGGIPPEAHYIRGKVDPVVCRWSSDPISKAELANCGHHLFPSEGRLMESSAIPIVARIVKERLDELKATSL